MGKTLIFVLSVLNKLEADAEPYSVLVLAHSRELAFQISNEFKRFSEGTDFRTITIIGGEDREVQRKELEEKKPHIVVGTPGRILDFTSKKVIDWTHCKAFILDECDQMLEKLGDFLNRHAFRRAEDIQAHIAQKASYDVQRDNEHRNEGNVQEIHEKCV